MLPRANLGNDCPGFANRSDAEFQVESHPAKNSRDFLKCPVSKA